MKISAEYIERLTSVLVALDLKYLSFNRFLRQAVITSGVTDNIFWKGYLDLPGECVEIPTNYWNAAFDLTTDEGKRVLRSTLTSSVRLHIRKTSMWLFNPKHKVYSRSSFKVPDVLNIVDGKLYNVLRDDHYTLLMGLTKL